MLQIQIDDYKKIVDHAVRELPNEACGLLGGVLEAEVKVVKEVYLLQNVDGSPEHFSMDPIEQHGAVKDMRKKGYTLLGNFHSHPETPARPSEEDKRLAYDPKAYYLILSLQEQSLPVLKAFQIIGNLVKEEPIEVIDNK